MAKRAFTDEHKAEVLVRLAANGGNVKRTARETSVAEQTIRDWKKQAERGQTPATVQAAIPAAADDFASKAETVRDLMLDELEAQVLNNELKGRDLIVGIGVLTEKSLLARGQATSRTETLVAPPSPEEIGAAVQDYLDRALTAGQRRDEEIVDAEWEEQAPKGELLPPSS